MLYTGPTYADHAGLFRADSNGRRVAHTGLRLVSYGEIQGNISERDVPLSSFFTRMSFGIHHGGAWPFPSARDAAEEP